MATRHSLSANPVGHTGGQHLSCCLFVVLNIICISLSELHIFEMSQIIFAYTSIHLKWKCSIMSQSQMLIGWFLMCPLINGSTFVLMYQEMQTDQYNLNECSAELITCWGGNCYWKMLSILWNHYLNTGYLFEAAVFTELFNSSVWSSLCKHCFCLVFIIQLHSK